MQFVRRKIDMSKAKGAITLAYQVYKLSQMCSEKTKSFSLNRQQNVALKRLVGKMTMTPKAGRYLLLLALLVCKLRCFLNDPSQWTLPDNLAQIY